jgi:hypothetical protein
MTKFTPHKELTTRYGGEIVMRNREPIELRSNEAGKTSDLKGSREHNPLNMFYESNGPAGY